MPCAAACRAGSRFRPDIMTSNRTPQATQDVQAASGVIRILRTINQLTVEAVQTESRAGLVFHILNSSLLLTPYHRASLWSLRDGKPRLLGVSGETQVTPEAPLPAAWRDLLVHLDAPERAGVLGPERFGSAAKDWEALQTRQGRSAVLWMPVFTQGTHVLGLWLERWHDGSWPEDDIQALAGLMPAYAATWDRHRARTFGTIWYQAGRRRWLGAALLALCVYTLFLHPVPLRVVAPCEVMAKDPLVIAAPLTGIVEEIAVESGQRVEPDGLLIRSDKRIVEEEHTAVRQQVQITQAQLARAEVEAFRDPDARAELQTLRAHLAQENVRLRLAQSQADKLEIRSPAAGLAMIEDPHTWRGRAVRVGERIMTIVDPNETQVRIWVPEDDNIVFDQTQPARVLLNIRPTTYLAAEIAFVAPQVHASPQGANSILVEAEWQTPPRDLKPGLKGTAILYGETVTVAYWLLRKPLAAVRRFFGV